MSQWDHGGPFGVCWEAEGVGEQEGDREDESLLDNNS